MLYVDARSCVDCGACLTACPVDAIQPHTSLTPQQEPFVALNAEYYDAFPHTDRTPLALVPRQRRLTRRGPFRFAVVGSGPAGMYVADELLRHPEVTVDVIDRLPTPYGLVRAGVAPDHQATKQVTTLFEAIEREPGFDYLLGVEVGRDVTHDELACHYDGIVYAVGAANDRRLGIPGEDLPGSISATDLVGWYNGHPDKQDLRVPLHHERVVVVGNGNVALDVARILTTDPDDLATTDIAALPWADAEPQPGARGGGARPPRSRRRRFHRARAGRAGGHRGPQHRGRHRRRADPRRHHQAAVARRARDQASGRGAAHAGAPVPHHPGPHPRHRAGHRCAGHPRRRVRGHRLRPAAPGDRLPRRAGLRIFRTTQPPARFRTTEAGFGPASTSPAGSSAAPTASSAPTSRARTRPSIGCSTTSTRALCPHPRAPATTSQPLWNRAA